MNSGFLGFGEGEEFQGVDEFKEYGVCWLE